MKAAEPEYFITLSPRQELSPRLLNRMILSKSSEIEAITKRCRGIKMFCLGERDTLLVTYISGSFFFFKDTLLCREKASDVGPGWGGFQKDPETAILHA